MTPQKPSLLVVDDEVDTCHNLSDILTDLGYHVDVAHDGPSALELVRRRPYELALLDLKMPGMDGLTLCREIKKLRAATLAIIVTAYANTACADEAFAAGTLSSGTLSSGTLPTGTLPAGPWHILSKPVDVARLLGLIEDGSREPLPRSPSTAGAAGALDS